MKKKIVSIFVSMLLFATILSVAGATTNNKPNTANPSPISGIDEWIMLGHDPAHTGYSTSTAPETNDTILKIEMETSLLGLSIGNGKIYVTSGWGADHPLYCIDAYTGEEIFIKNFTEAQHSLSPIPAIDENYVYLGGGDGQIYCLYASTGITKWSFDTGLGYYGYFLSSPTLSGSKIYISAGYGNKGLVFCLTEDGSEAWRFQTEDKIHPHVSPAVSSGRVYFGSNDHKVYCVKTADGSHVWNYTTGDTVSVSPAVMDGKIYCGSTDGNLYCLNADNGSLIWTFPTGGDPTTPAVYDGKVFIGSSSKKFYCIDSETGSEVWRYNATDRIQSIPAVADGKVYFGDNGDSAYCLNIADGSEIWRYDDGHYFGSGFAIFDGHVYTVAYKAIYAFGTNEPPGTPDKPDGPTEGTAGKEYCYTTSTIDPDGNAVWYKWDWGNEQSDWIGPSDSGEEVEECHTWTESGTYQVKVKARVGFWNESDWSEPIVVGITKPELEIGGVTGGLLKVDAEIKNVGDGDAKNVKWNVSVTGGILGFINKEASGTIATLEAEGTEIVSVSPIPGIGPVEITVTASADGVKEVTKPANGFVFFVFVIVS